MIYIVLSIIMVAIMIAYFLYDDQVIETPIPVDIAMRPFIHVHIHKKSAQLYIFSFIVDPDDDDLEYLGEL